MPSGWTATPASAALSINSGATASTTLQVKASAAAAPGTYNVVPRATNAVATMFVGAAVATYEVPIPCVRKAPTLTVSPVQQQGAPNVPVTYTVSVTNNDTGCASSSFSQNVTVPAGWTAAFSVAALSPNPGATLTAIEAQEVEQVRRHLVAVLALGDVVWLSTHADVEIRIAERPVRRSLRKRPSTSHARWPSRATFR